MGKIIVKENVTTEELLSYVNENFYDFITTKRRFMNFVRLFADVFCDEHGVNPVEVLPADIAKDTLAMLNWFYNKISINRNFLKIFDEMRNEGNLFYIFEFFDSFLHELRHHLQFSSNLQNGTIIVKNFARLYHNVYANDILMDNYPYFGNPIEIDARYYAYQSLKKQEFFAPFYQELEYRTSEISKIEEDKFDYVALLKDKSLRTLKLTSKPLRNIEGELKRISTENNIALEEDSTPLYKAVSKQIAPDFTAEDFAKKVTVDLEIASQRDSFLKAFLDIKDEDDTTMLLTNDA